jgi:hypothetical protein
MKKNKTAKKAVKKKEEGIDNVFDFAQEAFNTDGGLHTTLFVKFDWILPKNIKGVHMKGGEIGIMLVGEDAVASRRFLISHLGLASAMLEQLGLVGPPKKITIASEAWVSVQSGKDLKSGKKKPMMPSEDPNRIESLMVFSVDNEGKTFQKMKEIQRELTEDGEVVGQNISLVDSEVLDIESSSIAKDNVLDDFWSMYEEYKKRIKEDGQYKIFQSESKDDPEKIFRLIIDMTMQRVSQLYEEFREFEKKHKVNK